MNVAVAVDNLAFTYRGCNSPAIHDVNFSVREGQFVAVMGHAGAGKSTLCLCLNALVPRLFKGEVQGRVLVRGLDATLSTIRAMAQVVGFISQDFESQLICTSVEQEVAFGPENFGVPRVELRRRVEKYLAVVRLLHLKEREQATLSGGQKQLLSIAAVLALETPILMMDSPTSDLDAVAREQVLSIAENAASEGRSIIMVEHDAESVTRAHRIVLMKDGRVVAEDDAHNVLSRTALLEECGIRPPQLVALSRRLGWGESPLAVDETLELLKSRGYVLGANRTEPANGISGTVVLESRHTSHSYPDSHVEALRDINVKIHEGEFVAVLGQNGSGKSTLGKLLSGIIRPVGGEILAGGKNAAKMSRKALARFVGYVYQNPDSQIFATTVYEEVSFAPRNFGIAKEEIRARVSEALRAVNLEGYEERDPFGLTRGERQRLAVASILVSRPKVLILDEPTTGLDYRQQVSMMKMLGVLHASGHTVIVITHSMWVAAEFAARTIVMRQGQIIRDGPTRAVFIEEELLASANLTPPPIVQLSNRLGAAALTVDEMVHALKLSLPRKH
jgi:energy-coupling factor transporter ATP-binding protein EcfA2